MLNKELEKFKDLYSKYIEYMVELHNTYQVFAKKPTNRSNRKMKRCLHQGRILQKELQGLCNLAYKEELSIQGPDRPISNFTRVRILDQKEKNRKIVELLEKQPYYHGMYQDIATEVGVEERRVRVVHSKLAVYKQVLLDDQQKQS